jgi:hypothetical protein
VWQLAKAFDKGLTDRSMDEDSPHCYARLTSIERNTKPGSLDCQFHVRIGQNKHGIATGEFQCRWNQAFP